MTNQSIDTQKLKSRVALVTGGASGIGRGIAQALLAHSCTVVITDINQSLGERTADEIGAEFLVQDVSSEAGWQSIVDRLKSSHGRLDILVNNAGVYQAGNIEEASLEDWNRIQGINSNSVFLGCKYAISLMKKAGGSIINLSSGAALRPNSAAAAYSASKSAVWSLTRTTALHCAERGYAIRCNSIHPGMVDTPMVSNRAGDEDARQRLYQQSAKIHPLGRIAQVEDIAAAVVFLASDEAAFITGVALPVDGGYAIN